LPKGFYYSQTRKCRECRDNQQGKTYGFTNQWGRRFIESIEQLIESFPDESISYRASDQ
tara:strand:- start:188 stop:364 length:177 start_codon:yes stop_codon:yes gene_type:complete